MSIKKNARILGIRLDAIDDERITRFEKATHIEAVSLARAALKAALTRFEATGTLVLPLRIADASKDNEIPPRKPTNYHVLNEDTPPLIVTTNHDAALIKAVHDTAVAPEPEPASNRLRQKLHSVTKRGSTTA